MRYQITSLVLLIMLMSITACSTRQVANNTASYAVEDQVDFTKAALVNIELGQGYLEQGQVSRAKKKFIHALELAPKLPEAYAAMGYFFEMVGDNELAEKHYHKAIALGKNQAIFHDSYAIYLCGRGRYREAEKEFAIAMHDYNYPKTAQVYEHAGLCALQAKKPIKAEKYFKTAVRYDPAQVNAMLELADLILQRGDAIQAQYYLEKLRQQVEPTPRLLWLAIQAAKKNNDKNTVASNALLLKNLFADSNEYKLYLQLAD